MAVSKEELTENLKSGLSILTGPERLVLTLTYYEELTEDEICHAMDIEPFTYGTLLCNARVKMRMYTDIFDRIDNNNCRAVELVIGKTRPINTGFG